MEVNYQKYLLSEEWQKKRQDIFSKRGKKCKLCHRTDNIHIHHLYYKNLGKEKYCQLVVLCKKCHYLVHGFQDFLIKIKNKHSYSKYFIFYKYVWRERSIWKIYLKSIGEEYFEIKNKKIKRKKTQNLCIN